jgi:MoaA/NifB/PqqE/SkfB family radical SAM enzyme
MEVMTMKAKTVRHAAYHLMRLRCWAYVMRQALLHKKRFPLLRVSGLGEAAHMMNEIKIDRWIEWNGSYRQTLVTPLWPSPIYDRFLAKGGLNVDNPGDPKNRCWIDLAMVAMTRTCSIGTCEHCSERYNLGREEVVPIEKLHDVVEFLQERGTGVIAFTGGEPFDAPDRLLELVSRGDKEKSEFRVYTTGKGVTKAWAQGLANAGLHSALVSIDGYDAATHDRFRRKEGVFNQAIEAVEAFLDAGVFVFGNVTLSKGLVEGDGLERLWELLKSVGVPALQMIEPKTCGGYFKVTREDLFDGKDIRKTRETVERIRSYEDDGPVIYWVDEEERAIGCRAGGMLLFYVDSVGNVQPCVFLPISFGNILEEDFETIFERMRRATPDRTHKGCLSNIMTPALRKLMEQRERVPIPVERVLEEFERVYEYQVDPDFNPVSESSPEEEVERELVGV